jgi:hypothetical protein
MVGPDRARGLSWICRSTYEIVVGRRRSLDQAADELTPMLRGGGRRVAENPVLAHGANAALANPGAQAPAEPVAKVGK